MRQIMKSRDYKRDSIVIAAVVIITMTGCQTQKEETEQVSTREQDAGEEIYYTDTSKEDCTICGNDLNLHRGEDNLGIIGMNSAGLSYIEINRYDDSGRLIEKPDNGIGTNIKSTGEEGMSTMVTAYSNRGYATIDIHMKGDRELDMERAASNFCNDCLNRILEKESWGEQYGVGLIHYGTEEVRLLDESIRGFMMGDFYVSCEPSTSGEEEEISEWDILIFYCPERYK